MRRRVHRAAGGADDWPAVADLFADVATALSVGQDPRSVPRVRRISLADMTKTTVNSHDLIRVTGARVNNLKDVSVEIPKRQLTVFTGVSGSGKSSLVFDTIAAESQRLINETYSAFLQGFMPSMARPDVDLLEGLTTAIIVDRNGWARTPDRRSAPRPTSTHCCASCSPGSASRTSALPTLSPSTSPPSAARARSPSRRARQERPSSAGASASRAACVHGAKGWGR